MTQLELFKLNLADAVQKQRGKSRYARRRAVSSTVQEIAQIETEACNWFLSLIKTVKP